MRKDIPGEGYRHQKERPELNRKLEALREGDTVLVCELTRLSRSTKDLFELVERINA